VKTQPDVRKERHGRLDLPVFGDWFAGRCSLASPVFLTLPRARHVVPPGPSFHAAAHARPRFANPWHRFVPGGRLRTFSIDASTGALKQTALTLAMESFEAALASLSIDGRGRMLSLVDTTNDVQQTRAITDTTTGTLGAPFAIRGLRGPIATAFDPSREGVNYLVDSSNLYRRTIDPVAASYTHTSTVPLAPTIKAMVLLNR
jgi:hypothetical protein